MSRTTLRARVIALVKKWQPDVAGNFKASRNFMRAFLATHDITQRRATTSAPKLPPGMTKDGFRELFLARVRFMVDMYNIPNYFVISADETGVFLAPAVHSTLSKKGEKNVPVLFSSGWHVCVCVLVCACVDSLLISLDARQTTSGRSRP